MVVLRLAAGFQRTEKYSELIEREKKVLFQPKHDFTVQEHTCT